MEDYKKKVASSTKLIRVLSVILKNKQKQKLKQYCSLYRIFMAERFLGHAMQSVTETRSILIFRATEQLLMFFRIG